MLSAASCPFPLNSSAASRWREVQALQRRVCLLRSDGKNTEALELETGALADAVGALRACSTVTQVQLDWLFAAEEERVTSVRLLAEILLPMLTEAVAALPRPIAAIESVTAPVPPRLAAPATTDAPSKSPAATRTTPGLPGIADFIDEMLSQERPPRVPRRSP